MNRIMNSDLMVRNDEWGRGHMGAGRGARSHRGVDFVASFGTEIYAPMIGLVSHIGNAYDVEKYPERSGLKTICLETALGRFKFFYVDPHVRIQQVMRPGDPLGVVQNISAVYSDTMKNHVHVELWMKVLVDSTQGKTELLPVDPLPILQS